MSGILSFLRDELCTIKQGAIMVIPATALTAAIEYLGSGCEALITWLVLATLDSVFGIIVAVVTGRFHVSKMYRWCGRIFLQLMTVYLFAALCAMFTISSGTELVLTSWIFFFYACLDVSSLCNKLVFFGVLPRPILVIMKMLRRKFAKTFATAFDSPEFADEIEQSLKEHREKKIIGTVKSTEGN